MCSEISGWFGIDEFLRSDEKEFVCYVCERARRWKWLGISPIDTFHQRCENILTLAVDISDKERNLSLRTLRADYDGSGVVVGYCPTGQLVGNIDTRNQGLMMRSGDDSAEGVASAVADWNEEQLRRPIELNEWHRFSLRERFKHRRYVMADTRERLCWSDSSNQPRTELGPPDRVIIVRDFCTVTLRDSRRGLGHTGRPRNFEARP